MINFAVRTSGMMNMIALAFFVEKGKMEKDFSFSFVLIKRCFAKSFSLALVLLNILENTELLFFKYNDYNFCVHVYIKIN